MKRISRYKCRNGELIRRARRPSLRRGRHIPVNVVELHELTLQGMRAGLLDHKKRINQLIKANNDYAEIIKGLYEKVTGENCEVVYLPLETD